MQQLIVSLALSLLGLVLALATEVYIPHGEDIVRYYNKINFHNFTNYHEFETTILELQRDEHDNERLVAATNIILGVSQPECDYLLQSPAFRASQRYAGGDVLASAALSASEYPFAINDCAEVFFYRMGSPLDTPDGRTADLDHRSLTSFLQDQIRVSITFVNLFPFTVDLWWSDESKAASKIGPIPSNGDITIGSFIGHTFSVNEPTKSSKEIGRVLDFMVVSGPVHEFSAHNRLQQCENYDPDYIFVPNHCEDMETRYEQFKNYVWHQKRLGLNYVQPKFVPPVTMEGFMHLKLPSDTYTWLKEWYDREQKRIADTEDSAGPCMNQAVAPSVITHLIPEYKDRLDSELKPILHEWYGVDKGDIKLTSIYGIRKYTNGSVLRMHVDTVNTHVVSAIINVDQDVEKDWPLLILDHEDNEHNIVMKPGDMVLYESAKLLHGRPEPFVGAHYDNIFIHYCPESGWDYSWV